ncbi:MAG: hypothetical protein P8Z67_10380 [Gammaproteobacteria bacterium]
MNRINLVVGVVMGLLLWASHGPAQAATLTLHDPASVRDAAQLGRAIHHLSGKVMRCVARHGGKSGNCVCRDVCACRFKQDYAAVRKAFNWALRRHPGWAGDIIVYRTPGQAKAFSISFSQAMQHHFSERCHKRR